MIDTGVKLSIIRNLRDRGVTLELHPCTASRRASCSPADPTRSSSPTARAIPAALDYVVGTVRELVGKLPGVRDLPRPPAALPRGRPGDLQAAVRPPRRQPPGQGPDHRASPRSPARTTGSRCSAPTAPARSTTDEPVRWETDFGAAELTHINLYDRTVEGLTLRDVPGATVQYHPEAGPGPARLALPVRPLRRRDQGGRLDAPPRRHPQDPADRLRADRDRPGGRVRLLRHPGLPGADAGGLRGRARQLQPGDDHDRPRGRHRHLHRAAAAADRSRRSSSASGPTRCCRPSAARPRSTWPRPCTRTAPWRATGSS